MKVFGHRGAAGLAVENTITSIKAALETGVWGIELDLRLTADNHFVLSHDANIRNGKHGKLRIEKSTLEDVQKITLPENNSVPTAREAIRHILRANNSTMIYLDIKGKNWVGQLIKFIEKYPLAERNRFIVASFNLKDLRQVQKVYPRLKYLYLFKSLPIGLHLLLARKQEAWGIGISVKYFSRLMVVATRNLGLITVAYTVNSPKKAKTLQKMGVDYIVTDFPDRFAILNK